jgi:hypothetical protein
MRRPKKFLQLKYLLVLFANIRLELCESILLQEMSLGSVETGKMREDRPTLEYRNLEDRLRISHVPADPMFGSLPNERARVVFEA